MIDDIFVIRHSFVILTFNFTGTREVKRIEMLVINCEELGPGIQTITIVSAEGADLRVVDPSVSSCDYLVRVCLPAVVNSSVFSLRIITDNPSDWIHISKILFYTEVSDCTARDKRTDIPIQIAPISTITSVNTGIITLIIVRKCV